MLALLWTSRPWRVESRAIMRVFFVDLGREYESQRDAIDAALAAVVREQRFILGPRVEELERRVAALSGARFGVGCASGTDALLLALRACGVGPGDEVVLPPFTFFATAAAVARCGAICVFVDIDLRTFALDVEAASRALCERPRVRAVLPVHLYGNVPDLGPLLDAASARGVAVIEDAAQAIGAKDPKGRPAGGIGRAGCFSFYPTKNLGAYGDGGLVATSDEALRDRLLSLRFHGSEPPGSYHYEQVGLCSRLDALQAAILLVKLEKLDERIRARRANAAFYAEALAETPLVLPAIGPGHTVHQYTVLVPGGRRDALREHLRADGIDSSVFYPEPLHAQPALRGRSVAAGPLDRAERAAREALSLPVHPYLREEEREFVAASIRRFFSGRA
jgi:dTDP-4-amino-4,6-dideoxygalactose transaminase